MGNHFGGARPAGVFLASLTLALLLRDGHGAAGYSSVAGAGRPEYLKGHGSSRMNTISNTRQTTASGIRTGSISTEEIKSRIAAMFGDAPAAPQDK